MPHRRITKKKIKRKIKASKSHREGILNRPEKLINTRHKKRQT